MPPRDCGPDHPAWHLMPRPKSANQTGDKAPRRPTVKNADVVTKEAQALELRKAGASFQMIADKLGYRDPSSAHKAVVRALANTIQQPADELRPLEAERLDRLLLAVWPDACAGEDRAINRALQIMGQRAKLLGLNAPTRVDVQADVQVNPAEIEVVARIREWRASREG